MWFAITSGAALGLINILHCAGMCGPLATFACRKRSPGDGALRYQVGRSLSYSLLGALAGSLGSILVHWLSTNAVSTLLSWLLATALAWTAISLWLGKRPRLIHLRNPAKSSRLGKADSILQRFFRTLLDSPAHLGFFSAALPCAALASALIAAASSGSALKGALTMLVFSLVSGIALTLAVSASGMFSKLKHGLGPRMLAVVLLAGALVLVVRPLQLDNHSAFCYSTASLDFH